MADKSAITTTKPIYNYQLKGLFDIVNSFFQGANAIQKNGNPIICEEFLS
jgi:hypothetical protein